MGHLSLTILLLTALKAAVALSVIGRETTSHEVSLSGLPGNPVLDDPYYDFFTTDTPNSVNFTSAYNSPSFNVTWYHAGTFEAGKGWKLGSDRNISYAGTYEPNGHSFIGVTGWTRNPLVQYLIIDNFGTRYVDAFTNQNTLAMTWYCGVADITQLTIIAVNPAAGGKHLGSITSDNGYYTIYHEMRYNQPSIDGVKTYLRIWSVRAAKRTGGTITTKTHFDAWQSKGVVLGSHEYQAVTVQGYYSNGKANLTFKEVLNQ